MTEAEALIALNQLPKTGPVKIRRLLEAFGSAPQILKSPRHLLQQVQGIGPEIARLITEWEDHTDPSKEVSLAHDRGIQILTRQDSAYPEALRQSPDAPVILYLWGDLQPQDAHAIAVVGSRKMTHYGRETARKFSYQLAGAGLTIISGLARGIDTAAHEGALAANGRTIAVLGSGLMQVYPPENLSLAERIADGHGAVISEFPLLTKPDKQTFPQRNRIVAQCSRGLLVVECPSRSGSLITANFAGELGRTIYAVPGQIDRPTSAGCHDLIRDGAILVTDGSQILEDLSNLPLQVAPTSKQPAMEPEIKSYLDLPEDENKVMKAIGPDEWQLDELVSRADLPIHQLSVALMKLELKGLVLNSPGQRYRRK